VAAFLMQLLAPAFKVRPPARVWVDKTLITFNTMEREGALPLFLRLRWRTIAGVREPTEQPAVAVFARAGDAKDRRPERALDLPDAHQWRLVVLARLAANATREATTRLKRVRASTLEAVLRGFTEEELQSATNVTGVRLADVRAWAGKLRKTPGDTDVLSVWRSFRTNLLQLRVTPHERLVYEADCYVFAGDTRLPVAWKPVRGTDVDPSRTDLSGHHLTLDEYVGLRVREWRKADPAIDEWFLVQPSRMEEMKRRADDCTEISTYDYQDDLFLFQDYAYCMDGMMEMEHVTTALSPYWYTLEPFPCLQDIAVSPALEIMRHQGWTPRTMFVFFALWGIMLFRGRTVHIDTQTHPMFIGKAGTGKTTLVNMVKGAFQDHHVWTYGAGESQSFATSGLRHKRLVAWSEAAATDPMSEPLFKRLAINDWVTINQKHKTVASERFYGSLLVDCNTPWWTNTRDEDLQGIARRLTCFPFDQPVTRPSAALPRRLAEMKPLHMAVALHCASQLLEKLEECPGIKSSPQLEEYRATQFRVPPPTDVEFGTVSAIALFTQ